MTHKEQAQTFLCNGKYYSGKRTASLIKSMPWLKEYHGSSTSEKVWNVLYTRPKCKCGEPTSWINFEVGYRKTCCRTCGQAAISQLKSIRHEKLWASCAWRDETVTRMKEFYQVTRTPGKLDRLADKGITPLENINPGMQNVYRWQHRCGEVFERPFTRVTGIWCPACHVSRGQGEVYEFIRSIYGGPIIVNDRKAIKPREIDIYMPELKLGIEYHGEYWHPGDGTREADKVMYAAKQGITIIEIWEMLWKQKRPQQLAVLLAALQV